MFILDLHFPDCLVYLKGFFGLELLRRVSPGTLANSTYASIYIYIYKPVLLAPCFLRRSSLFRHGSDECAAANRARSGCGGSPWEGDF